MLASLSGYGRIDLWARWAENRADTTTVWLGFDQWDEGHQAQGFSFSEAVSAATFGQLARSRGRAVG